MKHFLRVSLAILGLMAITLLNLSCSTPKIEKADIYFVPVGGFPPALTAELVEHFKKKFTVSVAMLPGISMEEQAIDKSRRQAIAEELVETLRLKHQNLVGNSKAIVIGLTSADISVRQYPWKFAFTFRNGGRFAIVSSARMNPVNFGEPANEELLRSRLKKMVMKDIGLLYFGLTQNNNPRSVLYGQIGGVEELDKVEEEFYPTKGSEGVHASLSNKHMHQCGNRGVPMVTCDVIRWPYDIESRQQLCNGGLRQ